MDRPHHHHSSYHRPEEDYPPPPPQPEVTHDYHFSHNSTPLPTHVSSHVHHSSYDEPPAPPAPATYHAPSNVYYHQEQYPTPAPPAPTAHHSATHDYHHHQQQYPSPAPAPPYAAASVHHVSHTTHHETTTHPKDPLADKPSVRVYCKAKTDYSLTIRDGQVVLAPSNPSDLHQHWVKDEKYSTRVKDEEGFPAFALVNKATGQAMKHSIGATHPVQLIPYNANHLDESILWTESKDLGDTYRAVRMVNNIRLNVDAFNGDKEHGGVRDGTKIVLWEWAKGDNQRWKIAPY